MKGKIISKYVASAVMLFVLALFAFHQRTGGWNIADSLFTAGILLILAAGFRLCGWWGFFDLPMYGTKRLIEACTNRAYRTSELVYQSYAEYQGRERIRPAIAEPFVAGVLLTAASLLPFLS